MSDFAPTDTNPALRLKAGSPPLTVIFSFLSRADSSPLSERPKGPGHVLDANGEEVADPAADPQANVFERDPNIAFEKWGEYWRKVHGVRFTYTEDADDHSLDHLLRYDQIHRLAPGPSSQAPLPYKPPLDADGKLHPTIIGHIPPHVRPRWDGVAYLTFESPDHIARVFGTERVQTKIGPEDKAMFRDVAPMLSRQYTLIPSPRIDPISLVRIHRRNATFSRSDFQERWVTDHADLVLGQADTRRLVRRYVQLHNIGGTQEGEDGFHPETSGIDAVTLMSFANVNDVEDYLQSDGHQAALAAEAELTDLSAEEYWTALNINIVNKLSNEQASERPVHL